METETIKEWRIFELAYFVKDEHRRGVERCGWSVLLLPPAVPVLPVVRRSWWLLQTATVVGYSASRPPTTTPSEKLRRRRGTGEKAAGEEACSRRLATRTKRYWLPACVWTAGQEVWN